MICQVKNFTHMIPVIFYVYIPTHTCVHTQKYQAMCIKTLTHKLEKIYQKVYDD